MVFSEKLADVVNKFLDNANVGKFVTDVGPGFALSISMLMFIGLAGNVSVIPADRSALLVRRLYGPITTPIDTAKRLGPDEEYAYRPLAIKVDCVPAPGLMPVPAPSPGKTPGPSPTATERSTPLHATAEVHREIEALCLVLKDTSTKGIGISDPGTNLTEDAVYRFGRRTIADLGARIESLDARRAALLKGDKLTQEQKDQLDKIGAEKAGIAPAYEQLVAQKEAVDEARERLKTLQNELTDSRSFAKNIQVFTDNAGTLLAFSIMLGVILSQVSRLVFVNLLYDRILRAEPKRSQAEAFRLAVDDPEKQAETQKQAGSLVTDYYRYAEGAINMVAPTLLFGIAFWQFSGRFAGRGESAPSIVLISCIGLAAGLVLAGFFTYRDYRRKLADLLKV